MDCKGKLPVHNCELPPNNGWYGILETETTEHNARCAYQIAPVIINGREGARRQALQTLRDRLQADLDKINEIIEILKP